MQTFMSLIKEQETGEYIESLLACFAAPTIQGLKPGCLINLRRSGDEDIVKVWEDKKEDLLHRFGVDVFSLSSQEAKRDSAALLMIYKKELLARAIFAKEALNILNPLGYGRHVPNVNSCLKYLSERLRNEFPHEIGLFLGYPPEDVEGFMRDRGKKPLATGYWQVYGDVGQARKAFRRYKRAEYSAAKYLIRRSMAWQAD
jgi:hypothetical protein